MHLNLNKDIFIRTYSKEIVTKAIFEMIPHHTPHHTTIPHQSAPHHTPHQTRPDYTHTDTHTHTTHTLNDSQTVAVGD